jgi:predicted ATPase
VTRPSGTVTFLFTDIEGSTRRWETDPGAMRLALASHDEVLQTTVASHGGWLFKHTGDGVCAAFGSADAAVDAAVVAQQQLGLPVRMGIATGLAELRGDDYFGPVLNRAARVMAAGHGGQILVAASTASLLSGAELVDLGKHRLRDLSGAEHLCQVRAEGLPTLFPPLRTLDATPGNLTAQATSFIGREVEVKELAELVGSHRLVTLTGVGGVGKTRLALQVAAQLVTEFPDGVWLVELAPLGDPEAVAEVVAAVFGVTARPGISIAEAVAQVLLGRRLLIVLDNCEHVLDGAAAVAEALLARTTAVKVIATSREGLRVGAEQLWPVPSLDVSVGANSAAVDLFVDRARAVSPGFELEDPERAEAVTDICRRLDGIALAIELAAARMVSMSAQDVRDRLGDRFRLLAGARRGLERHQTLRHAVGWSYDLLDDHERAVLGRCSVFADGFDLAAAAHLSGPDFDEYRVLDVLDSLVRKSLITVEPAYHHARYGMLETIRQFAEDQLAATGGIEEVRDRHARYYADQAVAHWGIWDGPRQREALDWVDAELANLRAGFRWASVRADVEAAAAIAAHTAEMAAILMIFEPINWAQELLPVARTAQARHLPRLYTAASGCLVVGRPEEGLAYARSALALEGDARYEPFEPGISDFKAAAAHVMAGRLDQALEVLAELVTRPGLAHVMGLAASLNMLPAAGRTVEAMAIADAALAAAQARGAPGWIAYALNGCGRTFARSDPQRALAALRQGLAYAHEHRLRSWEVRLARDGAAMEAAHGHVEQALALFETTIDAVYRSGESSTLATTLANLVVFFGRLDQPDVAATLYGSCAQTAGIVIVADLPAVVDHLRTVLGGTAFDACAAVGAAMRPAAVVEYARHQIHDAKPTSSRS